MEQAEMKAIVEKALQAKTDRQRVLNSILAHIDMARQEIRLAAEQWGAMGYEPDAEFVDGTIDDGLAGWKYKVTNEMTLVSLQVAPLKDIKDAMDGKVSQ
jgi:hypothetical protein